MSTARLTTAIEDGLITLPEGRITVLRPAAGADLSALPRDRTTIVTTFRPDHDAWVAAGYEVTTEVPPASVAIVHPSRSKALSRALISSAAQTAPRVIVDGARTPFLKAEGRPGPFTPVDLAVHAGRALLMRQPFSPDLIRFTPSRTLNNQESPALRGAICSLPSSSFAG